MFYSAGSVAGPLIMALVLGQGGSWRVLYIAVTLVSVLVAAGIFWMHSPKLGVQDAQQGISRPKTPALSYLC